MELLIVQFCWVGFLAAWSLTVGLVVFSPMYERNALFQVNHRFRISDLLVLAAQLQIVFGLSMLAFSPMRNSGISVVFAVGVSLLLTLWWAGGLRMLANAGVEHTWHRWLFLGVVGPFGYASTIIAAGALFVVPVSLVGIVQGLVREEPSIVLSSLVGLALCAAAITFLCRSHRLCRLFTERARRDRAERDGIAFDEVVESRRAGRRWYTVTRSTASSPLEPDGIWLDEPPK